jgi:tetratricopeptide (TPR) repeat protein
MSHHDIHNDLFTEAMGEFAARNYPRAVELLTRVLDDEPDHRLARTTRGSAFLNINDFPAAVADFSRVIEADPDYARAFHLRGLAHEGLEARDDALKDFNRAIALEPEYGAAYYSRANLQEQRGDLDAAGEDLAMVAHLTERNVETFGNTHNVWRSEHLRLEDALETDLER